MTRSGLLAAVGSLLQIAELAEGLSGRALRKLPFQAHAFYVQVRTSRRKCPRYSRIDSTRVSLLFLSVESRCPSRHVAILPYFYLAVTTATVFLAAETVTPLPSPPPRCVLINPPLFGHVQRVAPPQRTDSLFFRFLPRTVPPVLLLLL